MCDLMAESKADHHEKLKPHTVFGPTIIYAFKCDVHNMDHQGKYIWYIHTCKRARFLFERNHFASVKVIYVIENHGLCLIEL